MTVHAQDKNRTIHINKQCITKQLSVPDQIFPTAQTKTVRIKDTTNNMLYKITTSTNMKLLFNDYNATLAVNVMHKYYCTEMKINYSYCTTVLYRAQYVNNGLVQVQCRSAF